MTLVRGATIVDDPWRRLPANEPLPTGEPVIIAKERYLAEREEIAGHNAPIGIVIEAGEGLAGLDDADFNRLALIALSFPKYTDGRAYSMARILRENHAFKGELRAVGNVLRDQIEFMRRTGFDSFEIVHAGTLAAVTSRTIRTVEVHYQPAGLEASEVAPPGTRPWLRVSPTARR